MDRQSKPSLSAGTYVDAVVAGYGYVAPAGGVDERAVHERLVRERVPFYHRPGVFGFKSRAAADRFLHRGG